MLRISDPEFLEYGYKLEGNLSDSLELLKKSPIPNEGNIYVRDDEAFHSLKSFKFIKNKVYGEADIEFGYCNGNNTKLNCLEWHNCPEVDIAVNDLVLLLALPKNIHDGVVDSKDVKAFLVKAGEAVVLHPYVMHFSPCKFNGVPFQCGIVLTNHTNEDLDEEPIDKMLWKRNKWLLAHEESNQAKLDAYIGIKGTNIEIK